MQDRSTPQDRRERAPDRARDAPRLGMVEGLVLSGGAGRRVGGRDKGLIEYRGQPAAGVLARTLAPLCRSVLVSANRNLECYRRLDIGSVVTDSRNGHAGPLAGLEAVRPLLRGDIVLVAPCDMPGLRRDLLAALLAGLQADPALDVLYVHGPAGPHYLLAALRRRALCDISERLDAGRSAVRDWLATLHSAPLAVSAAQATGLKDCNRPLDWTGPDVT